MKTAMVTGCTGQDGAYLVALLLEKGYRVHATHRRSSSSTFWRMDELGVTQHPRLTFHEIDIVDVCSTVRLLEQSMPQEVYNLAGQSFVAASFDRPVATSMINGLGALNLLEAIKHVDRRIRFYQASTAEMFGKVQAVPQCETTPFYPRSPYGVSKLFSHWMTINYREAHSIFACSGILFNHESPLRGSEFVTRRLCQAAVAFALDGVGPITLGNLDSRRDWGYAAEYVEGMWAMLQVDEPGDYVLATGRSSTVRDFATMAFASVGCKLAWRGTGLDEHAVDLSSGRQVIRIDPALIRPAEVDRLVGDSRKARDILGWEAKTSVEDLSHLMVTADLARASETAPKRARGREFPPARTREHTRFAPEPATAVPQTAT